MLFQLSVSSDVPNVRANIARTVGSLACLLVKVNAADDLNKSDSYASNIISGISEYLLKVCNLDTFFTLV